MAADNETKNNFNCESNLTCNIENKNELKESNKDTSEKNSDTNCNVDNVETTNSKQDGQISYDINSNLRNGDITKIFEPNHHNSMELLPKNTDIDLEMEKTNNFETTSPEVFTTYKTRFWVLGIYCYSAFMMLLIWGTFSPIMVSAEYAYDWTDGYIALLEGWGSIFSLITMIPFGYAVDKYGLRMGMILITVLESLATGLRCVTTNVTAFTYLASVSCIVNGMHSCVVLSLPPLISVVWFPAKERSTATAIAATAMQLGITGMYLSPLLVRTPDAEKGEPPKEEIQSDMQLLMFIYFGMALVCLVATLIYFPAAPPSPPSASSKVERVNFLKSIKTMIKKYDVMCIVLIYTFSTSVPFCWLSIINLSMECLGISQDESMWIAVASSLICIFMTIVIGRLTDYFHGYMKVSIASLLFASSGCFFWFLLITEQVIAASKAQVYISIIFGIALQYSAVPLMIELAVELAYPSPENAVGILFSAMLEICDVAFLLFMMIPTECYVWLSYALVVSTCLTIIPLLFVKEVYHRSAVDKKNDELADNAGVPNGVAGVPNP